MAPQAEAQSQAVIFDPDGPGMGLDLDFSNLDYDVANFGFNNIDFRVDNFDLGTTTGLDSKLDINNLNGKNYSANFNFEDTLKEAESSMGPHETFQEANTDINSLSYQQLLKLRVASENSESDALTQAEASNPGTSTRREPVCFNEMRAQKRKKIDEVDKGHILPEGSRRNRNKTARARGLD
jgi:hypothetical protein